MKATLYLWIDVNQNKPEPGDFVMVAYIKHGHHARIPVTARYELDGWHTVDWTIGDSDKVIFRDVTHWRGFSTLL